MYQRKHGEANPFMSACILGNTHWPGATPKGFGMLKLKARSEMSEERKQNTKKSEAKEAPCCETFQDPFQLGGRDVIIPFFCGDRTLNFHPLVVNPGKVDEPPRA